MSKKYFISGNGTDVGKTVISACLVHALKADYWKPVQAGDMDSSDSHSIESLAEENFGTIHSTIYSLSQPMSPHAAAKIDGVSIHLDQFDIPKTENHLIIEGAGGLMVPLNENETIMDLIKHLNIPLILVCGTYLGSINHSLLSIFEAKRSGAELSGVIFFGNRNDESERIILKMSEVQKLGGVYPIEPISKDNIGYYSQQFKNL